MYFVYKISCNYNSNQYNSTSVGWRSRYHHIPSKQTTKSVLSATGQWLHITWAHILKASPDLLGVVFVYWSVGREQTAGEALISPLNLNVGLRYKIHCLVWTETSQQLLIDWIAVKCGTFMVPRGWNAHSLLILWLFFKRYHHLGKRWIRPIFAKLTAFSLRCV